MERDDAYGFLRRLADASAAAIEPHFRAPLDIADKAGAGEIFDPVTEADRAAEKAMRALIAEHFPGHGILGEEFGTERGDAAMLWVLDPIDGTRAFMAGLPVWGTLVGLLEDGKPAYGMMHQPYTGELYLGDGHEAWLQDRRGERRLAVRSCAGLAEATLMTTSPFLFSPAERAAYGRVEAGARLARYGTDCYAYCQLAAGHVDIVVEAGLAAYDIAALIPIVEGAGGLVTTWKGGPASSGGRVLAAGDRRVHAEAMAALAM